MIWFDKRHSVYSLLHDSFRHYLHYLSIHVCIGNNIFYSVLFATRWCKVSVEYIYVYIYMYIYIYIYIQSNRLKISELCIWYHVVNAVQSQGSFVQWTFLPAKLVEPTHPCQRSKQFWASVWPNHAMAYFFGDWAAASRPTADLFFVRHMQTTLSPFKLEVPSRYWQYVCCLF